MIDKRLPDAIASLAVKGRGRPLYLVSHTSRLCIVFLVFCQSLRVVPNSATSIGGQLSAVPVSTTLCDDDSASSRVASEHDSDDVCRAVCECRFESSMLAAVLTSVRCTVPDTLARVPTRLRVYRRRVLQHERRQETGEDRHDEEEELSLAPLVTGDGDVINNVTEM